MTTIKDNAPAPVLDVQDQYKELMKNSLKKRKPAPKNDG